MNTDSAPFEPAEMSEATLYRRRGEWRAVQITKENVTELAAKWGGKYTTDGYSTIPALYLPPFPGWSGGWYNEVIREANIGDWLVEDPTGEDDDGNPMTTVDVWTNSQFTEAMEPAGSAPFVDRVTPPVPPYRPSYSPSRVEHP